MDKLDSVRETAVGWFYRVLRNAVLNTRHATAKEKGWAESPPSAAEFAKEPNLLKRSIVVAGDKVIVGFNKNEYGKL